MGEEAIMIQMNIKISSRDALLEEQWDRVKGALESLGKIHSTVNPESHDLEDIIENFVMKVEFDSPLALAH